MKRRTLRKIISFTLAVTLVISAITPNEAQGKKKVKLNASKLNIEVGKRKTLKVKNSAKKATWTAKKMCLFH